MHSTFFSWVQIVSRRVLVLPVLCAFFVANAHGQSGGTNFSIDKSSLNFGRVRVGKRDTAFFTVRNGGGATLQLLADSNVAALGLGLTIINHSIVLSPSQPQNDTAIFAPNRDGYVLWVDTVRASTFQPLTVLIDGTGVSPQIGPGNHDFGSVRLDSSSPGIALKITNIGTDTTYLTSVTKLGVNANDFALLLDSTPTPTQPVLLDTSGVSGASLGYIAKFSPSVLGPEMCVLRIVSGTGISYDTLTGIGAEPHMILVPQNLNFGKMFAPRLPGTRTDLVQTLPDTVINIGSIYGVLDSLHHTDTTHFHFDFSIPNASRSFIAKDTLAQQQVIPGLVHFSIDSVGDYYDTVTIASDWHYPVVQYIAAHVRLGHPTFSDTLVTLDTVRNCDSIPLSIMITNPYKLGVTFDSIIPGGNNGGFTLGLSKVRFPINIAAGANFPVTLSYRFPEDSGNGLQRMFLQFYERSGDNPELIDTVEVRLVRMAQLVTTYAVAPAYVPSSSDALPFRLPIYITGDWLKRMELDSFQLRLQFPNDLFQPVGVDRTGSLTERLAGDSENMTLLWDQATRTYSITLLAQHLSEQQDTSNTLLITILLRAFVSADTISPVVTLFRSMTTPCAVRFSPGVDTLGYANDCGDQEIRSIFTNAPLVLLSAPIYPDPISIGTATHQSVKLQTTRAVILSYSILDVRGAVLASCGNIQAIKGLNVLRIPTEGVQNSGVYFLRIEAIDPVRGARQTISTRFVVTN